MRAAEHHLFFSRDLQGELVYLDADESRHALRVLRLRPGDALRVTDGTGVVRLCTLAGCEHGTVRARVVSAGAAAPSPVSLSLYVGLPERSAMESLVEGVTALGVSRIVPVVCEYCQERWWARAWATHAARLERKMVAAAKQSLNPRLPALAAPIRFDEALAGVTGILLVADQAGPRGGWRPTGATYAVDAFVGPPGGFSPGEREALAQRGGAGLPLSPNRLRTELAAVALAALVMAPG